MIEKPEQDYDTRRHQLYYQWRESEYFSHQEPIYHRTREYIESLEAENAQLRELTKLTIRSACIGCPRKLVWRLCEGCNLYEMSTELGIEVDV